MPTLTIDGKEVTVAPGMTVLQACEAAGVEVPRFCYHERLSIAGNCRMCLVEQEKAPKPIASCAMPAGDGMVIHTNTPSVKKAREGVMEFLLINHPLDCPICDQGGECDLQDQSMAYGTDSSRFDENKRAVTEKYMGPLVKTVMTRCIHCTRCVRFAEEVAGVEEIGAVGRGEHMEITTYLEQSLTSELSGNVIDLCPVGALTSKPYAFTARSWELEKTETVDVHDALGSNIRVDARGREVMRILPRLNEAVNQEWISDKTRFAYDGLKKRRLDKPWIKKDGKLQPASWQEAFETIRDRLQGVSGSRMAAITGGLADVESTVALKDLMTALGVTSLDCREDGAQIDPGHRAGYLFNPGIAGIDEADAILIVGSNPRLEAPVLNARLRARWLTEKVKIGVIGQQAALTYGYDYLGAGPDSLAEIADSRGAFADVLKNAQRPMLILGQGALARDDGGAVLALARKVADTLGLVKDGWNGFAMLHTAAGRVGALDVGFVPGENGRDLKQIMAGAASGQVEIVYLLHADELDTSRLATAFVIYQGSHGDAGARVADVILPGAAYTEKNATYVNTEGRVQRARKAVFAPGDAREDWTILRALSAVLNKTLPYDSLQQLRDRLGAEWPHLQTEGEIAPAPWSAFGTAGSVDGASFVSSVTRHFMTNPITRASDTLAECQAIHDSQQEATGTDG